MAHPGYCIKEGEIATLQNEQTHINSSIEQIQKDIASILKKLNNGITTTMENLSKTVKGQGDKITTLEALGNDFNLRDINTRTRKKDLSNMNKWKKAAVIIAGLGLLASFGYTIGNLFIWIGNILQNLPK